VALGLRNNLLARSDPDLGHHIENLVYLELLRRGYEASIEKLAEKEIDFVAQTAQSRTYYQVAASVLGENTLMRELAPLKAIPDHYPKVLLTLDVIGSPTNIDGIQQKNLLDWLVEDDLPHR
jgi:predicted AAA+ superfamily ATPase